ncbi:MAG: protein tyrosine phosphatase family protein [Alphaproteobacteria bacterium]|nr:protein tyrosine phosphatase family protein [Alphaproteobacteria bacterium]
MKASLADIRNFIEVDDQVGTAGQPTAEQFRAMRAAGYEAVVNLLPREQKNALKDEDTLIRELGMEYYYIPVVWSAPQQQDFVAFCEVMERLEGRRTFVHCAMNMRVTAFYSSYAIKYLGWTEDKADALVARVWHASPGDRMDDTWREFIARIRH